MKGSRVTFTSEGGAVSAAQLRDARTICRGLRRPSRAPYGSLAVRAVALCGRRGSRHIHAGAFFWRTYDGKEIDLVEERDGRLYGYELKWRKPRANAPKLYTETYPESEFQLINRENYLQFLVPNE